MLIKTLLQSLADRVVAIEILTAEPNLEQNPRYERAIRFKSLQSRLTGR